MTDRAAAAVVRALDDRRREATEEVEGILAATMRVSTGDGTSGE